MSMCRRVHNGSIHHIVYHEERLFGYDRLERLQRGLGHCKGDLIIRPFSIEPITPQPHGGGAYDRNLGHGVQNTKCIPEYSTTGCPHCPILGGRTTDVITVTSVRYVYTPRSSAKSMSSIRQPTPVKPVAHLPTVKLTIVRSTLGNWIPPSCTGSSA